MTAGIHAAARAFLVAANVAMVADALLALLTSALSVTGPAGHSPWWVEAHLVERCRWVVLALLLMAVTGWMAEAEPREDPAVWRGTGMAVIGVPLLWIAATWIVQAILFTVARRWDVDGQVFLAADYYRRLFVGYVPWLLGGAATMVASRHVR